MHPNEGFEIGLMTKTHTALWCTNLSAQDFLQGKHGQEMAAKIDLINECPHKQVQMHISHAKEIGEAQQAVLLWDGKRLFVHAVAVPVKEES